MPLAPLRKNKISVVPVIFTWIFFSMHSSHLSAASAFNEEDLKAAFLYNFADFITWPVSDSGISLSNLDYCVLAKDEVASSLESLLAQEQNQSGSRRFRLIENTDQLANCDLIFLTSGNEEYESVISESDNLALLTVGDQEEFLEHGGMIQLIRSNDRIEVRVLIWIW